MKISMSLGCLGLGAALLVGCGKKEEAASDGSAGAAATAAAGAAATAKPTTPVATVAPKPVNNDGDAAAVRGCCAALRSAADAEKEGAAKSKLSSAAGICDGYVSAVKGGSMPRGSAISSLRAAAGGKPLPGACN